MIAYSYNPTKEQQDVIAHEGSAFVTACPGAGKTTTMVERARRLLNRSDDRRGLAFLSFTNAAVNELEARLRAVGELPVPLFPSFIGTFDRFLWQFLLAPFGIPGCNQAPRLIPDKGDWEVKPPYGGAQSLRLRCFDRTTGKADAALAKEEGFNVEKRDIRTHETCARAIITKASSEGLIDFEDVRMCIRARFVDRQFARRIGVAVAARFREIVVDEAHDCNPADLAIVEWLRQAGVTVKIICDPNQSIYGFRGGVRDELQTFAETFDESDRLSMSGNFRSTPAICAAIVMLRPPCARHSPDRPLGRHRNDSTPVHVLSYGGTAVSPAIGSSFRGLVEALNIPLHEAPVLAATRTSAANAIGQPVVGITSHMTLLLAEAVMNYHFAFAIGNRRDALLKLHRVILQVQGRIGARGDYHAYIAREVIEDSNWRPEIIALANSLHFDPAETADQWLTKARTLLAPSLIGASTINQRLRDHRDLKLALAGAPVDSPSARTIHSAKGLEFPAVCVVLTTRTVGNILDFLESGASTGADEDARKIYVGASRAQRLLAMAVPKGQASRLKSLLTNGGCPVQVQQL